MQPMLAAPSGATSGRWAQQKLDGHRLAVTIDADGNIHGWNRGGERTKVPARVAEDLATLVDASVIVTLDGELLDPHSHTATLYVFDMPYLAAPGGVIVGPKNVAGDVRHPLLAERLRRMAELFQFWNPETVVEVPTARTPAEVDALRAELFAAGAEGLVHKSPTSRYEEGRRGAAWVKEKFTHDVDVMVTRFGLDGRDNYEVAMVDPRRAAEARVDLARLPDSLVGYDKAILDLLKAKVLVAVGEVSRLTGDGPRLVAGDVVAVNTLYAQDVRLVQPVKGRLLANLPRDDKGWKECTIDQLDHIRPNRDVLTTIPTAA